MRVLAAAIVLIPVTAAAQSAETREAALREEALPPQITAAPLHVSWRTDATLAETNALGDDGHTALATASAGAEVAVSHEACDIAVAGGQISATADGAPDTAPIAGEQWASLCPLAGMMTLTISHHLEWDVRPTLLARPRLRPSLNRRETVTFGVTGYTMQINDPGPLALWHPPEENLLFVDTTMHVALGWARGDQGPGMAEVGAEMTFFGYRREREDGGAPLAIDVIHADMDTTMASSPEMDVPDATGAVLDAVTIDGARVGAARLGGRVGVLMGDVIGGADAMGLPRMTTFTALDAGASAEFAAGGATWRLAADRGHWGLWDGRMVIDDRVSAGVAGTAGRIALRGEGFVARDHLIGLDGTTELATGGGTAIVESEVGRHTTVRLRADAGRGFYATGAGLDDPRWGAEVLATVSMHAGTR